MHTLTSRHDLAPGEVCWRRSSRWREENYFRHARTHFALDALYSYAAAPYDPARLVPSPAKKTAAARVRQAEAAVDAPEAERDARLLKLRSPAPGQAVLLTNQMADALQEPVEAAHAELEAARAQAAAIAARTWLGDLAPDMMRLEAEARQITHAIRIAACNADHPDPRPRRALCPRRGRGLRAHPRGPRHLWRHLPRQPPAADPARSADRAAAHPGAGRPLRAAQPVVTCRGVVA